MDSNFYNTIKSILLSARNKVYQTANFAMVEAYWNIGKSIVEEQGGNEKAEYGTGLLQELSKQMTQDFGKGFTVANLKNMRQFYLTFANGYALRSELSWTHYRLLMRVENEHARNFYMQEAVDVFAPKENVRIKMNGSGLNFVHGGISLQEMVVPVIDYHFLRNQSRQYQKNQKKYDTKPVEVSLLSATRKVSNMISSEVIKV